MSCYLEKTCKCIKDISTTSDSRYSNVEILDFHAGREYQVDMFVHPPFFQVYQNGGYNDYVYMDIERFLEYFRLID